MADKKQNLGHAPKSDPGIAGRLEAQIEQHTRKRPYVVGLGRVLGRLRRMGVSENVKGQWRPPCSKARLAALRKTTGSQAHISQ